MVKKLRVGVLALQGDVIEHIKVLQSLKANAKEVRRPEEMKGLDGLIIPGGESTTISKLLAQVGFAKKIAKKNSAGMAVFGTCAGAIIVSKKILGEKIVKPLGLIDIEVRRNAYGTQLDSFETRLCLKGQKKSFPAAFIRAPIIKKTGKSVEVLCENSGNPVLVKEKNVLAGTFHTELYGETAVHRLFLEMIRKKSWR